jgi:hypothetical protein
LLKIPMTFYTDSFPTDNITLAPGQLARGGFMHRCGYGFLFALAIVFIAALTGCLGKSTSSPGNGGVATITLGPSGNLSMDVGTTQVFSATAKDASGRAVPGVNIQYIVTSGTPTNPVNAPAPLSIATNGNACAGTWDASIAICSPGNPGIATIQAFSNGYYSTPAIVYVHQHIDNIQIVSAESLNPQYDCFSQGQTWIYQAKAYSNNVDITSSVGPVNWSSSNSGVVTTLSYVPPNQITVLNQVQVTAKAPGITDLSATVSGTTSTPYPYTTCLIKYLRLQVQGSDLNTASVNNGSTVPIAATAVDTLGVILQTPPLTWSTTDPEVAAFSSTTNTTGNNNATARNNLGGATVFASCTPPSCNIGVLPGLPIYASNGQLPNGAPGYAAISLDVTSTSKPPTYTAWAATTQCDNAPGCSSALFSVTPGTNPVGSILSLPRTPNSMLFNHLASSRLYIGSNQGLMYVDVASNPSVALVSGASTPCDVSLCGTVLTISNDGKQAVVSDNVSSPSHIYIYSGGSTTTAPIDLILDNPAFPGEFGTAASFSPDQSKLFVLTNKGNMYIYSTIDALTSISVGNPATNVMFSADGSFAYVAGAPGATSVSGFANCDNPTTRVLNGVTTSAAPVALYPLPTAQVDSIGNPTQVVLAVDPPYIDMFGVNVTQFPLLYNEFACTPPTAELDPHFPKVSYNLGQGNYIPLYTQLVGDATEVIVVAKNVSAVLMFNIANGTTTSIPLVGGANPLSASASTDGSQVYVAACDQYDQDGITCSVGSIHIVATNGLTAFPQGDFQQVQYVNKSNNNDRNMCNNGGNPAPQCLPNMVAIKPQ